MLPAFESHQSADGILRLESELVCQASCGVNSELARSREKLIVKSTENSKIII